MKGSNERFLFASAPDSWGVLDYPGPSWEQSYEKMLDEMIDAGYTGTELGPYGFFPVDAEILQAQLAKRKLELLGSFVPVRIADPEAGTEVLERIRKVGKLLAALKAPFLVMADDQSSERNNGDTLEGLWLMRKKSPMNLVWIWCFIRTSRPMLKRQLSARDSSMPHHTRM